MITKTLWQVQMAAQTAWHGWFPVRSYTLMFSPLRDQAYIWKPRPVKMLSSLKMRWPFPSRISFTCRSSSKILSANSSCRASRRLGTLATMTAFLLRPAWYITLRNSQGLILRLRYFRWNMTHLCSILNAAQSRRVWVSVMKATSSCVMLVSVTFTLSFD